MFIDEYMALGHTKAVNCQGSRNGCLYSYDIHNVPVYFLAHHAVFYENNKTTKLCVVYNGSGKSKNNTSLNDVLLNDQSELFENLVRFRTYIHTLM